MANQVTRKKMERWLIDHDFSLKTGRKTSGRQFRGHGITITLPGRGPSDLTKMLVGQIIRQLQRARFDKEKVLHELRD